MYIAAPTVIDGRTCLQMGLSRCGQRDANVLITITMFTPLGVGRNGLMKIVGSEGGKGAGKAFTKGVRDIVNPKAKLCVFCGRPAAEVDHVIPRVRGGNNSLRNAQPLCRSCNASKGSKNFPKNYSTTKKVTWFLKRMFGRF
jgi:hypothetical protein